MKKKTIIISAVVIILFSLGFLIAQSFREVRHTSQDKSVQCNLRQVASAAQQYFLETGYEEISFDDLVGPGKYLNTIEVVNGENYRDIFPIREGITKLSINTESGRTITYSF